MLQKVIENCNINLNPDNLLPGFLTPFSLVAIF